MCPVDAGRRTPSRDSDSVTDRIGGWRSGAAGRVQPGTRVVGSVISLVVLGVVTLPIAIAFFCLEVGLIATLQAFIFATLTSIYFGEASAGGH